jgi:succinate dehydrogenase / fumarate reductase cytochrome b subunit
MRYRLNTGSFAWIIHRVTGIALALYLCVHLYVLSNLKDPWKYESILDLMKNPLVKLSEIGLLALVVAHGLNGARLTLLEYGVSTKVQKKLFWVSAFIGILVVAFGAIPILGGGH